MSTQPDSFHFCINPVDQVKQKLRKNVVITDSRYGLRRSCLSPIPPIDLEEIRSVDSMSTSTRVVFAHLSELLSCIQCIHVETS